MNGHGQTDMNAQQDAYGQTDMNAQQNAYGQPQDAYGQQDMNGYGQTDMNAQQNAYGQTDMNAQQNAYGQQDMNAYGQPQNPYSQQGMYSQSQNPYGQPQNPYGPPQNPAAPQVMTGQSKNPYDKSNKKGMDKKKLTTILLIVGGVLLIGLALFLIFGVFFTPKKRLKKAMEANGNADYMYTGTPYDEVLGMGDISKAMDEKGGTINARLGFNHIGGDTRLDGVGFGGEFAIDKDAKQLSFDLILDNDGKTVFDGQLLADEDKTYLTIVDYLTGYIVFDNKNIGEKLKKSFLSDPDILGDLNLPFSDLDYFGGGLKGMMDDSLYGEIGDDIWEASEVKSSGSETLDLGGRSVKCKAYEVVIPKDDIKEIINKAVDKAVDSLGSDSESVEDIFAQAGITDMNEFKMQLKAIFSMMITEDIVYKAYVNGGHVVAYSSDGTLNLVGTPISYSVMIKNTGEKNVLSSGEMSVVFTVQGVSLNLYSKYGSEKNGNTIDTFFDLSLSSTGMVINVNYDQKYDISTGKIDISGEAGASGESITLKGSGSIKDINKGKSFTAQIDSLTINYDGEDLVDMNLELGISTERNVKKPDSSKKMVNLFDASRDEFEAFISENEATMQKLGQDFKPLIDKIEGNSEP